MKISTIKQVSDNLFKNFQTIHFNYSINLIIKFLIFNIFSQNFLNFSHIPTSKCAGIHFKLTRALRDYECNLDGDCKWAPAAVPVGHLAVGGGGSSVNPFRSSEPPLLRVRLVRELADELGI